jgi:hypothetical protein
MNNERAELIRKAMQRNALKYMSLFGELQDAQEAIAKKDAALDACEVTGLQLLDRLNHMISDPSGLLRARKAFRAAITKAQECRK